MVLFNFSQRVFLDIGSKSCLKLKKAPKKEDFFVDVYFCTK